MKQTNMHDAKSKLSQLVAEVIDGQEVVIANAGKPVARLVAYQTAPPKRTPGYWKGKIRIADNFDDYMDPSELVPSLNPSLNQEIVQQEPKEQ